MRIHRDRVVLVAAAPFGIASLVSFASFVASGTFRREMATPAVIGMEIYSIQAPAALIAFARAHDIRSHEQLDRLIGEAGLEGTWFAVTMRERHGDGGISDVTKLIRPGEKASQFGQTVPVLRALAGRPTAPDYRKAKIRIVPEHLMFREPREAFEELRELEATIP